MYVAKVECEGCRAVTDIIQPQRMDLVGPTLTYQWPLAVCHHCLEDVCDLDSVGRPIVSWLFIAAVAIVSGLGIAAIPKFGAIFFKAADESPTHPMWSPPNF